MPSQKLAADDRGQELLGGQDAGNLDRELVAKSFDHKFEIEWEFAEKVSVAGDFNGWRQDEVQLERNKKGLWSTV